MKQYLDENDVDSYIDTYANTGVDTHINTADEYRDAIEDFFAHATNSIDIFTQNLESEIYNNSRIEEAALRLAKRHPNTQLRILVRDSTFAVQNGHCLIRLAQRLTSSVFIRKPSQEQKLQQNAFVVVDQKRLIIRPLATERSYRASIYARSPRAALEQTDFFNDLWKHSLPDVQTQRLYL